MGSELEMEETFTLNEVNNLEDASHVIVKHLSMQCCERSDRIPEGKMTHTLLLSGLSNH